MKKVSILLAITLLVLIVLPTTAMANTDPEKEKTKIRFTEKYPLESYEEDQLKYITDHLKIRKVEKQLSTNPEYGTYEVEEHYVLELDFAYWGSDSLGHKRYEISEIEIIPEHIIINREKHGDGNEYFSWKISILNEPKKFFIGSETTKHGTVIDETMSTHVELALTSRFGVSEKNFKKMVDKIENAVNNKSLLNFKISYFMFSQKHYYDLRDLKKSIKIKFVIEEIIEPEKTETEKEKN